MRNRIAVIIPYFGEFPIWFELFLYSCSRNDFIDFIFYTDCTIPSRTYSNTIFYTISFAEYCSVVSNKLGINFQPQTPYKLCDLKPFYGYVHDEDLKPYEFWGFGDMDLIYGNMKMVLNEDTLLRYDLITTHADRVAGHFTVIRKDSEVHRSVLKIKNWQSRLEAMDIYGVDEHDLTDLIYPLMPKYRSFYRHFIRPLRVHLYDYLRPLNILNNLFSRNYFNEFYTSEIPRLTENWRYDVKENKIINPRGKEIPYLHFLFFKKTPFYRTEDFWKGDYFDLTSFNYNDPSGYIVFNNKRVFHDF